MFTRFAIELSSRFEERMAAASDRCSAQDAVVTLIVDVVFGEQRDLVLAHELYTLAAREPVYRALTADWMRRSRAALECHFDPETTRILDALIEGLSIHRALDDQPRDREEVELAVARVVGDTDPPSRQRGAP